MANATARLDVAALREMTFQSPDTGKFPCLRLAYQALAAGGTAPAVLNAANESAVEAFLCERIRFGAIPHVVESVLAEISPREVTLENIFNADREARSSASRAILGAVAA